ncbi:MAG TPA: diguanylate cyclase, partial [Pseudomonadales bacterium]|nr:diguanylate cyclase [Pseudomonadales bacterium]
RDGKTPRPVNYHNVYWDLVLADDQRPRPAVLAAPLLDMIRQAGVSDEEMALLAEAKANSDALTHAEFTAMALVESVNPNPEEARAKAIAMLHDAAYHQAKFGIMRPIGQFLEVADHRTHEAVEYAKEHATRMRLAFITFGVLLVFLLWHAQRTLHATLGGSVDELYARIVRLGGGDFASAIPVADNRKNSVLGWLSETQLKLNQIDLQRKEIEARNQRLTQLYAALSQCNQAIVRCTSDAELFEQICRVVVTFGGMKMAWIGELDAVSQQVKPITAFGSGMEYLQGLQISVNADEPSGRGPTGTALRENSPVWSQDCQHDPNTAYWQNRFVQFGWAASAALPLHCADGSLRVLTLYADVINAFDEDVRNLLIKMAMDIDFALKSLQRELQREQAEKALRASEQRLRTIIETEPECVKVVDCNGRVLQMNGAGLAMLEADSLEQVQQQELARFVLPEHRRAFKDLHLRVMKGESGRLEFEVIGLKGTRRWLETHAAPMRGDDGAISMLLGISRDVTARKQSEQRIHYLAHFDALTGLPNRSQHDERAEYAISLAHRNGGQVALMFLDLDHFKDINDTLGHRIGDALLVTLANRIRLALR